MDDFMVFERAKRPFYIFPTHRKRDAKYLIDLIPDHGGRVVDYHDKDYEEDDPDLEAATGYALIDPSQQYAPDLLKRRMRQNERGKTVLLYLNWGYVQLCIDNKTLLKADLARGALTLTQRPQQAGGWAVYLSHNLGLDEARLETLKQDVMRAGATLVSKRAEATIVITSDSPSILEREKERYYGNSRTRVESYQWIQRTLRRGYVRFTPAGPDLPMPGRVPVAQGGRRRVPFTKEDQERMAEYLAQCGALSGEGRQGRAIWRELCSNLEKYPWASRHTPNGWRDHYGRNKDILNPMIEAYILDAPFADNQGRDKRTSKANRNPRKKSKSESRQTPIQSDSVEPQRPSMEPNEEEDARSVGPLTRSRRTTNATVPPIEEVSEGEDAYVPDEELPSVNTLDDLNQLPKSTPPRRERVDYTGETTLVNQFNGSTRQLTNHSATSLSAGRLSVPGSAGFRSPITIASGGSRRVPLEDIFEEYNAAAYSHPPEVMTTAEAEDEEEEVVSRLMDESMQIPHLDMKEYARKSRISLSSSTKSATAHALNQGDSETEQDDEEDDDDDVPARSFQLAGSAKLSDRPSSISNT